MGGAQNASCTARVDAAPLASPPLHTRPPHVAPLQEFLAREKQKRAEREAEKAKKAAEREAAQAGAQVQAEGSSA